MKPGRSSETHGLFPRWFARAIVVEKVDSLVAAPLMTSTRFIRGTGCMKWRPMTRSLRWVEEASRVMEMEEVLVARMA